MALAAVIPAAELTSGVLVATLAAVGGASRKVAISLKNDSGYWWEYGQVYFESGTSDAGLPPTVAPGQALVFGARKTDGPVPTGSVGVITYYIQALDVTVALMWSVPFDYNLYSNWWNATVWQGYHPASYDVYCNMYYDWAPQPGDGNWKQYHLDNGWKYSGSMGHSGAPELDVSVYL